MWVHTTGGDHTYTQLLLMAISPCQVEIEMEVDQVTGKHDGMLAWQASYQPKETMIHGICNAILDANLHKLACIQASAGREHCWQQQK